MIRVKSFTLPCQGLRPNSQKTLFCTFYHGVSHIIIRVLGTHKGHTNLPSHDHEIDICPSLQMQLWRTQQRSDQTIGFCHRHAIDIQPYSHMSLCTGWGLVAVCLCILVICWTSIWCTATATHFCMSSTPGCCTSKHSWNQAGKNPTPAHRTPMGLRGRVCLLCLAPISVIHQGWFMFALTGLEMVAPTDCPVCLSQYNDSERRPMSLRCGHTLCNECTSCLTGAGQRRCPTCRECFTTSSPNYALCDLVDAANLGLGHSASQVLALAFRAIFWPNSANCAFPTTFMMNVVDHLVDLRQDVHVCIHELCSTYHTCFGLVAIHSCYHVQFGTKTIHFATLCSYPYISWDVVETNHMRVEGVCLFVRTDICITCDFVGTQQYLVHMVSAFLDQCLESVCHAYQVLIIGSWVNLLNRILTAAQSHGRIRF